MSDNDTKSVCLIAANGALDIAYMPLIIASTAAAMDMKVAIFFTFYGLDIIKKNKSLSVSPIGNAAAPPPIKGVPIGVPNIMSILPGMTSVATMMMNSWMKGANVASIDKLINDCQKLDVRMIGCQMTMDVMGVKKEHLIDGVEIGGAATMLDVAVDANIQLAF